MNAHKHHAQEHQHNAAGHHSGHGHDHVATTPGQPSHHPIAVEQVADGHSTPHATGHVQGSGAPRSHTAHAAHTDHSGHETTFRRRFWLSLVLSVPVLLYSHMLQMWLGFSMPVFAGSAWIAPLFALIVFIYGGTPFLQMAVPELRNRRPGMMTLISLAIGVAFIYSAATPFIPGAMDFYWEMVLLIDIMLLGHWLEMRSVRQAAGALDELAKLMPDRAERVTADGTTEVIPVASLATDDVVLVRPGASIPADGEVQQGESDVDEAIITGESRPVGKHPGDAVVAGTINGAGSLRVRVTATGEATALAGIMRLVQQAQQSKSHTQILADRAAGMLFYVALAVAVVTAVAWIIAIGFDVHVLERVATVLVIACPHALGLAVPLVVAISTNLAARNGILVRDRLALEEARLLDTVVFDKTGTLTQGEFGLVDSVVADGWEQAQALALAAAVEGDSEHTIARAIRKAAAERRLDLPEVTGFAALKGRGVVANSQGHELHLGGPRLLEMLQTTPPTPIAEFVRRGNERGHTIITLVQDGEAVAAFALADVIRPESKDAVAKLHALGIQVAMLTGDSRAVATTVAQELGIDQVFAEVLPEHKDRHVAELRAQGKRVAMIGDGVNDAPALTRADVGIAIGSGADVAVESAGIILVRSNPLDVVKVITLSRASYGKMIQNLWWAAGYNIVALPLAAGILAPAGILLSPAVGAILMSLSTIVVAINAQFLRRAL